jgi:hypothetical protein
MVGIEPTTTLTLTDEITSYDDTSGAVITRLSKQEKDRKGSISFLPYVQYDMLFIAIILHSRSLNDKFMVATSICVHF